MTYDELAAQVGLSASAALRRVKRLEEAGVIAGYVALVAPERVGLGLTAYINVRLEKHTDSHKRSPMDLFAAAVQTWPEVVECAALTGEMDYLLHVAAADFEAFAEFALKALLRMPGVKETRSSFVLQALKPPGGAPL